MSPLTRSRATPDNVPTALMAEYYGQRATAGLIVLDHSAMGTPPVPETTKKALRAAFKGTFILAGGFDQDSAERALNDGRGELIAFGRPFIANPDWVARMQSGAAGNALDTSTFYTPGPKGYTDYPTLGA
ncbi:MAG: hypothetical protein RL392_1659 [Pseudomonadota bacterium]